MTAPLDIIVPTWNRSEYTVPCLRAIARHARGSRVIWIDNGSSDEEYDAVANAVAELQFVDSLLCHPIWLPTNLGFVKATNVGLAASTAPHVLLLNNDCQLVEGAVGKMLAVFDLEPTVGLVGPRASGTTWQARVPGALNKEDYAILPEGRHLAFFCTLIKREVIERVGYLSERFRMGYGDDDEYGARAERAGFRSALRTDVTVIHEAEGTFPDLMRGEEWEQYKAENLRRLAEDTR